ncbi:hypothetical protein [Streptomyces decoyicus]|uniref:hypothetical protein n=1 Tax=Streptomyces decoyicus TaxID=249567 RepID=UPI003869034C|nr:hypothetical protein OG532_24345 [Streptomyces decoyicus]
MHRATHRATDRPPHACPAGRTRKAQRDLGRRMEQRRHFAAVREAGHRAVDGRPDLLPDGASDGRQGLGARGIEQSAPSARRTAAATADTIP